MAWHSILFWLAAGLMASFLMAVLVGKCMALGRRPDRDLSLSEDESALAPPAKAFAVLGARSR